MNNTKTIYLLVGFIAAMIIAVGGYNLIANKYSDKIQQNNNTLSKEIINAPDFTVYDEQGNPVKLSDFAGKPVVINFWASWCGYCVQEMPDFNKAYSEYKDVKFLMINVTDGQQETKEKAKKFISEKGFDFEIFYDTELNAANTYGTSSLPATVFVDKQGNISGGYLGAINYKTISTEIEKIIK